MSINIAAHSEITFRLLYEELLQRRLGMYEHVIHVDHGQPVDDFVIDVNIHESREITYLRVPPLRNDLLNTLSLEDCE